MAEFEIVRGSIDGAAKYCRIPIRSKTAERMMAEGIAELSAESILAMPHDVAVGTIDAIMEDWSYWVRRANELFVMWAGLQATQREEGQGTEPASSAAEDATTL